jgi:WD40 repeat protein
LASGIRCDRVLDTRPRGVQGDERAIEPVHDEARWLRSDRPHTFGNAEQRAAQPTWTPDGSRIIFTLVGQHAGTDSPRHAAVIDADGSNIVEIGVDATHPRLRPGPP